MERLLAFIIVDGKRNDGQSIFKLIKTAYSMNHNATWTQCSAELLYVWTKCRSFGGDYGLFNSDLVRDGLLLNGLLQPIHHYNCKLKIAFLNKLSKLTLLDYFSKTLSIKQAPLITMHST